MKTIGDGLAGTGDGLAGIGEGLAGTDEGLAGIGEGGTGTGATTGAGEGRGDGALVGCHVSMYSHSVAGEAGVPHATERRIREMKILKVFMIAVKQSTDELLKR